MIESVLIIILAITGIATTGKGPHVESKLVGFIIVLCWFLIALTQIVILGVDLEIWFSLRG